MEKIRVRIRIATNKIGSECVDTVEFDADKWNKMTEEEREKACWDIASERLDWSFEVV